MSKGTTRRVRVTLSLSADWVRRIDKSRKGKTPRSRAVEALLEEGELLRKQRDLDEEIRAYYAVPPTKEEEALSKALSRLAIKNFARNERKGW